mmetsp:Transcript_20800/g.79762  ORF Transcript_20800/g.79762 Transcript_20800/m.79762 type:complete len:223 (-) Transcript_20800:907-1575(-)
MVGAACLSTVWPEGERVEALCLTEGIEPAQVAVHVVHLVREGRVLTGRPVGRARDALLNEPLRLALVVNTVKGDDVLQELCQLGVGVGPQCRLEERRKDVVDEVVEAVHSLRACLLVDGEEARRLDHPAHVGREELVVQEPAGQLVPLARRAAVDAYAVLCQLVLESLELVEDLARELGEVLAVDVVVRLEEDLSEPALAAGVVLEVELVEAVEGVVVRVHV